MKCFWIILLLTGCQSLPALTSPQATAAQTHLDQIKSSAADAQTHLQNVSTDIVRKEIESAKAEAAQASLKVDEISPLVDEAKSETANLSNERNHLASQWEAHKDDLKRYQAVHNNDWLGPRAHRWICWICVAVSLLGIGYVLLMAAGEMEGGALAGAVNLVGHLFTFGLKFVGTVVGKVFAWIFSKINSIGAKAAVVLQKASPHPPPVASA